MRHTYHPYIKHVSYTYTKATKLVISISKPPEQWTSTLLYKKLVSVYRYGLPGEENARRQEEPRGRKHTDISRQMLQTLHVIERTSNYYSCYLLRLPAADCHRQLMVVAASVRALWMDPAMIHCRSSWWRTSDCEERTCLIVRNALRSLSE